MERRIIWWLATLSVSSTPFLLGQPPVQPALAVVVEASSITVTGATPGGKVVFFGVAREPSEFVGVIVRRERIETDSDSDGKVRYDLGKNVPLRSMWVAVDLANGQFRLVTPEGYPLRQFTIPQGIVHPGPAGKLDTLVAERAFVAVLVARQTGAWVATIYDGATIDASGPGTQSVSTTLAALEPVGDSGVAPEILRPGDVVIVMDPNAMDVFSVRLPGGGA